MPRKSGPKSLRITCWYVCAPQTFDRASMTPGRFARLYRAGLVVEVLGIRGSMV